MRPPPSINLPNRLAGLAAVLMLYVVSGLASYSSEHQYERLELPPAKEMTRADIWFLRPDPGLRGILVLCPGANGNGLSLIQQQSWVDFAKRFNIGLAGIHFESPIGLLAQCKGYYQASLGSGDVLLKGLRNIFGKDLPIILFGFSGGAHFTTRFLSWNPDVVQVWAAAGAGVLDAPCDSGPLPPGIMACGENDPRLGGALVFFKQGRALGNHWLWVEIAGVAHALPASFEGFARRYFESVLCRPQSAGIWVDVDRLEELSDVEAAKEPSLSGWLPDRSLLEEWQSINPPINNTAPQ